MRGRIKRLIREASSEGVLIRLRDGGVEAFDDNTARAEMFPARVDLLKGVSRDSEILAAVRNATPESRRAFEREYGSIEMEVRIVASPSEGGWVEVYRLAEDGRVEKTRHEGGEGERMRQEARQGHSNPTGRG